MILYLLGVIIPPIGILLYGKIVYAALNALLWTFAIITPGMLGIILWFCAAFHASYVIHHGRNGRLKKSNYSF